MPKIQAPGSVLPFPKTVADGILINQPPLGELTKIRVEAEHVHILLKVILPPKLPPIACARKGMLNRIIGITMLKIMATALMP